jgi:hypothetical protein
VPPEAQGLPRGSANPKEKKADLRLATATMMVADTICGIAFRTEDGCALPALG